MRNLRLAATLLFALAVAACGGGGGGGSSSPGIPGGPSPAPGGGGGNPSSHPSATPSPGTTPTPAHTSTPGPTPTPLPTNSGSGNTILPDTTGRFGLTQILDWNGINGGPQLTQSQIQTEAPHYDSVWGAFFPQTWDNAHQGMIVSRYELPNEDTYLISGHDLAWWEANHPTWILYGCDNNNNPTQDLAWYGTYFHDVPLDIHNPDVVAYQVQMLGQYMISNGYNTLAIDNVLFQNYGSSPNPDLGEGDPKPGWYGCGIYTQPNFQGFQQIYSGGLNAPDPTWIADMENWIATARQTFNSNPQFEPYHLHLMINHPVFDSSPNQEEQNVLNNVDAMVDENGFTHYDDYENPNYNTNSLFQQTLSWMEWAQTNNKAILITDYYCKDGKMENGQPCSTDPNTLTAKQVDWALSTYALGNNGGADVYISPDGGANYSYRSEYATQIGKPCAGGISQQTNLYVRKFADAWVLVDPVTGGIASYSLPSGWTFADIEGRSVGSTVTMTGPDGYVLRTTNGCS